MTDFPEPTNFVGDEDDRDGGYINRSTGPRRTDYGLCHECGKEVRDGLWASWLGPFCSRDCANVGVQRHAARMDPRRV